MSEDRREFESAWEAHVMPCESDWFRRDDQDPDWYALGEVQAAWEGWSLARSAWNTRHTPAETTGWPPGMLQDASRELSKALASKPDARRHAREAAWNTRPEPAMVDLTDAELEQLADLAFSDFLNNRNDNQDLNFARRAIAADRKKNGRGA